MSQSQPAASSNASATPSAAAFATAVATPSTQSFRHLETAARVFAGDGCLRNLGAELDRLGRITDRPFNRTSRSIDRLRTPSEPWISRPSVRFTMKKRRQNQ